MPLLAVLAVLAGISWWLTRPRPFLEAVSFGDLPGWRAADLAPALSAFRRSCAVLGRAGEISAYGGSTAQWRQVCAELPGANVAGRAFFESNFIPYEFGREAVFTGYYEPTIRGSRSRHGRFQTPVYGAPNDLVRVDLGAFSPKFTGEHIAGRLQADRLVPYPSRGEIDGRGLAAAPILLWCDDPIALFFLQIQGSGRVQFDDGRLERLQYAGENGRPYTAIGKTLVAAGRLARDRVSLQTIRAWLKAHPRLSRGVMEADQSFVFFREAPIGDPGLGSPGVEKVALTPEGSLAIDLRYNVLGAPYYVAASPIHALLVAQDTGGAIRGAFRGDIFFGSGARAEAEAGRLDARGRLFVLLPKSVAAGLGRGYTP
ncbi:MAG: murein transglycosylase A [Rhizomicrobium sp.]